MFRIRPLSLSHALALATLAGTSLASCESTSTDTRPQADQSGGKTAGEGSSVNSPGSSTDNDSSDTGSNSDAADGAAGGSNSTGEATGSGAGHSGGNAEDQDSR